MLKLIAGFFLVTALSIGANAQAVDVQSSTVRWNASSFTDQIADTTIVKPCQFVTYGTSKIDWVQKGGKLVQTLTVNSITGTWSDANSDGSITYNVSLNENTGTLSITRSGSISITLNLTGPSVKISKLYTITNFDIL